MKELLSKCQKFYQSTIIATANIPYEKIISVFRFDKKYEINTIFVENKHFGIQSILKHSEKLKIKGINLLK